MEDKMANKLKALYINCSIKKDGTKSHTQLLMNRSAQILEKEGVLVKSIHALDYKIGFGMEKDLNPEQEDQWPEIQAMIDEADILVIGSPIWLGVKASVATLVIERMYAYSGDYNDKGQYLYYGKVGGVVITGNEDGAKAVAMDVLYALSHMGYTIPPQVDCAWLGEAGPGPSYGDTEFKGEPVDRNGYDNNFTNRNATIMSWNLMHHAKMLQKNNGIDSEGNNASKWRNFTNAEDQDPQKLPKGWK